MIEIKTWTTMYDRGLTDVDVTVDADGLRLLRQMAECHNAGGVALFMDQEMARRVVRIATAEGATASMDMRLRAGHTDSHGRPTGVESIPPYVEAGPCTCALCDRRDLDGNQ
jgi:hypothetical protein